MQVDRGMVQHDPARRGPGEGRLCSREAILVGARPQGGAGRGRAGSASGTVGTWALTTATTALRPEADSTVYWRAWPQRFDYIYLLFTEDGADNPAPDLLTQVFDGGRFQLYRVGKARTAQSSNRGMPHTRSTISGV